MEFQQRKANRIPNYDYNQNGAYFITICTQNRKKILSRITVGTPVPGYPQEPFTELLDHGRIAEKYIRQLDAFYSHISVDRYVIMPDHIHLLLTIHGTHRGYTNSARGRFPYGTNYTEVNPAAVKQFYMTEYGGSKDWLDLIVSCFE